jgi:hypothetical protein
MFGSPIGSVLGRGKGAAVREESDDLQRFTWDCSGWVVGFLVKLQNECTVEIEIWGNTLQRMNIVQLCRVVDALSSKSMTNVYRTKAPEELHSSELKFLLSGLGLDRCRLRH